MTAAVRAGAAAGDPELRRRATVGLLGAVLNGGCGFLLTLVVVRAFGPAGAGQLFTAIGLVSIIAAGCCLGADTGLVRSLPRGHAGVNAAGLLLVATVPPMLLALVVAVAGVLGAGVLGPALFGRADAGATTLLRWAFVGVPLTVAMTLLLAAVRATRPIGWYVAVQSVLVAGSRPVLVAAAVATGGGVVLGFGGWLLPGAAAVALALALLARPLGLPAGARPRAPDRRWRAFWGFALPRAASAAIDAGSMWVGVLLTAALAGPAQAGVFAAVARYALAGLLVMHGLRVAIAPQLSRLFAAGRSADAARAYRRTALWTVWLSWPGYLLLAVFGPGLLQLFGTPFRAGAAALAVLAVAMLVNVGVGLVQTLLLMGGHSRAHLLATAIGLGCNGTACLLLIPRHGALGAATAWALGIVVENVTATVLATRAVGEPLVTAALVRAAVGAAGATGVACLVGVLVAGRGLAGLATALIVGAAGGAALLAHPRVRATVRAVRPGRRDTGAAPAAPR